MAKNQDALQASDAERLLDQLQVAHLLAAGFYKRMLPLFDSLAADLESGLDFWYWEPAATQSVPRASTRPTARWEWDFLPLYASLHAYRRCRGDKDEHTDIAVAFVMLIDDGFEKAKGNKNERPDPLKMESGRAVLRAYVYLPNGDGPRPFAVNWDNSRWPATNGEWDDKVGDYLRAVGKEWPLAEVMADPQIVANALRPYCSEAS